MTGFDTEWVIPSRSAEEQPKVMIVHFRPDKLPKDKAEWYEWLGSHALLMAKILRCGGLGVDIHKEKVNDG